MWLVYRLKDATITATQDWTPASPLASTKRFETRIPICSRPPDGMPVLAVARDCASSTNRVVLSVPVDMVF